MQLHKRIMYTFLLASKYFTRTLLSPPPHLSYCTSARYKTGSESTILRSGPPESGPSARCIFINSVPHFHLSLILRESACGFFCFVFVFVFRCSVSLSDFFFSLESFLISCFQCFSFALLVAFSPLDLVAPSQSLIAFFLQVTKRFKGETPLG